jgi:hypothetical protein
MREPGGPTPEDFQNALDYAAQGAVVSDTGLSENVEAALDKVRDAAPNPPAELIAAAREAYMRQRRNSRRGIRPEDAY